MSLYDLDSIQSDELYRLCIEHQRLNALAEANTDLVEITATDTHKLKPHPPVAYEVRYRLKSIVGVDQDRAPIYGEDHRLAILLPKEYPLGSAECQMITDTWHPNIKSEGDFKGNICTNHGGFGPLYYLDELVVRIGEFLQYKRYLAEDVKPFPEDPKVARWVRDYAEPNQIVNREAGKWVDDRPWRWVPGDKAEEMFEITIEEISTSEKAPVERKPAEEDDITFI